MVYRMVDSGALPRLHKYGLNVIDMCTVHHEFYVPQIHR